MMFVDIGDSAKRQYIDARSSFELWEAALRAASEVRGGMYWKRSAKADYLIRTSPTNSQKSLGVRSAETEAIYERFTAKKAEVEARELALRSAITRHQRLVTRLARVLGVMKSVLRVLFIRFSSAANVRSVS